MVIGQDAEKPVIEGRKADAILAAHFASEAALRLVKPGNEVCTYCVTLSVGTRCARNNSGHEFDCY